MPGADFDRFLERLEGETPWLPPALAHRLARAYGSRTAVLLGTARSLADLGEPVLPGLFEAEIDWLRRHEFARTADDILRRRSRLALHLARDATPRLDAWLAAHPLAPLR